MSLLMGKAVSYDFFHRHWIKIFLIVVLVMFYISTKYQWQTGMEAISRLEERLNITKGECIRQRARYMSRIRESSMTALADSVRPGLAVQPQPPFELTLPQE